MYRTLISATELASLKSQAQAHYIVVDCRHDLMDADAGKNAYVAGHIAGAVFAHLDHDLSGAKTDAQGRFCGRHPLPAQADLIVSLRRLGLHDHTQVIAYDAHGGMFAARLWWLLRSLGHEAVAVLDGGLAAWMATGQTLQTEIPTPTLGSLTARPALTRQVDVNAVLANLDAAPAQAFVVVDARAPDRFRGENETMDPVGGHIPQARNRFFKDNLQADGCFKPASQLRAEWTAVLGDQPRWVMQCGSGVTACHNLLALEVAGMSGAALYPGSWSEWCSDPGRPVA